MNVISMELYTEKRGIKMLNDKINNTQMNVSNEFKTKIISELDSLRNGLKCTPKDAANIAEKILHIASDAGFYNGQATPAVKIIRAFGIELFRTNNMLQNISGVIYAGGRTKEVYKSDPVIFTDNKEPYGHQRFVMVHELAHYLFDYIGNPNRPDASYVFAENYPRNNHNSDKEKRADRFAAALLMPNKLFRKQYNIAMHESNNRIYTIKYLALYFQVKESSIERRIDEVLYYGGY